MPHRCLLEGHSRGAASKRHAPSIATLSYPWKPGKIQETIADSNLTGVKLGQMLWVRLCAVTGVRS